MRVLLVAICIGVATVHAGVIQGIVVEHATGRALARASVTLTPLAATAAADQPKPVVTRTALSGQFSFGSVLPGLYILTASRDGFFTGSWGARLPTGRGMPITVTADSKFFGEMRLRHKGAITGRVLDENGVGVPGMNVIAYPARQPLRSVSTAVTDDRGVYRVTGLEPGKYLVRSAGRTLEDGTMWLPTFGPQSMEVRDARVHAATVDSDTGYADISPIAGRLYQVSGTVTCDHAGPVVVTLSSDAGQQVANTICLPAAAGTFSFDGVAPGLFELFATFADNSGSAYSELSVGGNLKTELSLRRPGQTYFMWSVGSARASAGVSGKLFLRRQSLSETGPVYEAHENILTLAPGWWELKAQAPAGHFVQAIFSDLGPTQARKRLGINPNSFEFFIYPRPGDKIVRLEMSRDVVAVEGRVEWNGKPVPGVPVFLWPVAESARRGLGGAAETTTAADGTFRLVDLPAGEYKALASFDINELDQETVEAGGAASVQLKSGSNPLEVLTVWTSPL